MNRTLQLRVWLALGASSAALLAGAPALAQGGASNTSSSIQEIVVTAEKRSVTLQSVPVAVTAFTSKERALVGINSVQDMTNFTPGLTYSSQLDRPVMRGLARSTNIYAADSSVGVYDNDLFTNSTFLVGRDDMIVDQVEILLGPQNTLYGRNAIGGVINTQSKRPTDIWTGEVRAAYGNYDYSKVEGTISGPLDALAPGLSFRLSAFVVNQDKGYFKNLEGKSLGEVRHDPYFELQLKYSGDKDDLWLMMYDLRFNGDRGGPGGLLGTPSVGPYDTGLISSGDTLFFNPNYAFSGGAVPGSVVNRGPGSNPTTRGNRITSLSQGTKINVDGAYSFNFHWIHHFDGVDVKYVGGYSQYHYKLTDNNWVSGESGVTSYQLPLYPLAAVPILAGNYCGYINAVGGICAPLTVRGDNGFTFETQTDWYSHEINFSSTANSKLSWIAGAYYYNETDNNPETEFSRQPQLNGATWNVIPVAGVAGYIPTLFAGGTPAKSVYNASQSGDYVLLDYQDKIETEAVFGQIDYKFNDQWKLTAGVRYTYDHKTAQEESKYIQFANAQLAGLLGQYTPALDVTPLLTSYAPGKGVKSAVSFPTTGPWAGDAVRQLGDNSSAVTGTFGVEWTPDPVSLYYARYNRGYKAFALNAGYTGANPEAVPEQVNDYELGFKKTFAKVFQLDADAFYYDYSNDQLPLGFPVTIPGGTSLNLTQFVNIPKAVSAGVEFTAVWNPIRHLNLSLTYGFDHTEITTGCAKFTTPLAQASGGCFIDPADPFAQAKGAKPAGPATSTATAFYTGSTPTVQTEVFQSVKGNSLPQAPENKIAFNANYTFEFDPGKLTLSGSYIWKDQSYSSIFTRTQYDYAPSWSQVDLRATWSGNHDKYEVVLYVKNLFDTIGYDAAAAGSYNGTPQGGGSPTYTNSYDITPPRLFGAEVHYKF